MSEHNLQAARESACLRQRCITKQYVLEKIAKRSYASQQHARPPYLLSSRAPLVAVHQ